MFYFQVDHWKGVMDANVLGVSIVTREAVKSMKGKGISDGHIINIGSTNGHRVLPVAAAHYYSASKHAVRALTEGIRNEVRALGKDFRVTEISPGLVETEIMNQGDGVEAAKEFYSTIRPLQPEDVAESVLYVLGAPPHVQVTELMVETTDKFL